MIKEVEDKRKQLLAVAKRLFAEHGYEGTSTRMIARESGINLAMVSYYFGSKEKLFAELVMTKAEQNLNIVKQIIAEETDHWKRIEKIIYSYVDRFFDNHEFERIVHRELSLHTRGETTGVISDIKLRTYHLLSGLLAEGQAAGVFKKVDHQLTITTLFGTLITYLNSSTFSCKMFGVDESAGNEVIFGPLYRERLKTYMYGLFRSHLSPIVP